MQGSISVVLVIVAKTSETPAIVATVAGIVVAAVVIVAMSGTLGCIVAFLIHEH